jgi:hypothetical protein
MLGPLIDQNRPMARSSLFKEFVDFLKDNKKWWLLPLFVVFALLAGILLIAQTSPALAPFIYTLF